MSFFYLRILIYFTVRVPVNIQIITIISTQIMHLVSKTDSANSLSKYQRYCQRLISLCSERWKTCKSHSLPLFEEIKRFKDILTDHGYVLLSCLCLIVMFIYYCYVCSVVYILFSFRLPLMRGFRDFSTVVRQMPGYNSQRWGTTRTLPN